LYYIILYYVFKTKSFVFIACHRKRNDRNSRSSGDKSQMCFR